MQNGGAGSTWTTGDVLSICHPKKIYHPKNIRRLIQRRWQDNASFHIARSKGTPFTTPELQGILSNLSRMIAVIQRVSSASITIRNTVTSAVGAGVVVLIGIEEADGRADCEWLASKIVNLRIFNDKEGVMNLNVKEVSGEVMIVSQFTLHASTKKGNRPSYIKAAKPVNAMPVYEALVREVQALMGRPVKTGEFGADMKVNILNDGPVTIIIDTKNKV